MVAVVVAAWWCCCSVSPAHAKLAPLDIEVTIPPLLEQQPNTREVLFTVTHDPEQPPVPFTLPCSADGLPAPSYSWLKDGEQYDHSSEGGRVEQVEGEGTLVSTSHSPKMKVLTSAWRRMRWVWRTVTWCRCDAP